LLVACLFESEKSVVIRRKKEGVGVENKEFFAVCVVPSRCKKVGLEVKKENKVRSKRYRLLIVFALLLRRIFLELKKKRRGVGIYKVMYRIVIAVLLRCNLNAFAV